MSQTIAFASVCPSCRHERPQSSFNIAAIVRLLDGGFPIEAYCEACKEYWPIDVQKRLELAEAVAAASVGGFLLSKKIQTKSVRS